MIYNELEQNIYMQMLLNYLATFCMVCLDFKKWPNNLITLACLVHYAVTNNVASVT